MKTKTQLFDGQSLLAKVNGGKSVLKFKPRKPVFRQGDAANSIFYIEKGSVKLTVVSKRGKEAVVAILGSGDFLGEACLAGEVRRITTATPLSECTIVRLDKASAIRALQEAPPFSELFLAYLLSRNIRIQEDLVDQLFNSSEKRLARVLLMLANFGPERQPDKVIARISQETLAEMIGTTRSRVNYFMNKFRRLGFINYNGHLEVHGSLLSVVLHD
jgi:CRP/FNR family transcriptional regulator, cyclic AMP receptor protein